MARSDCRGLRRFMLRAASWMPKPSAANFRARATAISEPAPRMSTFGIVLFEQREFFYIQQADKTGGPEHQGDLDEPVFIQDFRRGTGIGCDIDDLKVSHQTGQN